MNAKKLAAEALGTALLLIGVVGSGIMAQTLAGDAVGLALLANAIATGCMLFAIITVLGPVSGAHFNPAVTLAFLLRGQIAASLATGFILAQLLGAVLGVWASHLMFELPVLQSSSTLHRTGVAQWFSEAVATFGLLFVIFGGLRARPEAVPALVAAYITGAYWFTASTSFANPAVTVARCFTENLAGIFPGHIPMLIVAQVIGVGIAHIVLRWLLEPDES